MKKVISLLSIVVINCFWFSVSASESDSGSISRKVNFLEERIQNKKPINFKDFDANTTAGRALLSAATRSTPSDGANADANADADSNADTQASREQSLSLSRGLEDGSSSFLGNYAIKFQDCHTVSEWNGENAYDGSNEARILKQNLVRFRLCPLANCQNYGSTGCSSKYGDYVVDIHTFLYYYLSAQTEANTDIQSYCKNECQGDSSCVENCYYDYGYFGYNDNTDDDGLANFDPIDYAQCSAFDNFYMGPYCADDGKGIYLGLFADDSCSSFSSCDVSCFYSAYGFALPYATTSLVSQNCLSCAYGTVVSDDYNTGSKEQCQNIYADTGKCETKMYIDYPNEAACTYVNGLKHLTNGKVNANLKRSKEAGFGIGIMAFSSMLLSVYVHYLFNKLKTARFHLSSDAFR